LQEVEDPSASAEPEAVPAEEIIPDAREDRRHEKGKEKWESIISEGRRKAWKMGYDIHFD
jgi:hypothetical protein